MNEFEKNSIEGIRDKYFDLLIKAEKEAFRRAIKANSDELPENYSFAIFEAPPNRLAEFESIGMEPSELRKAAEIYKTIKEKML